MLRGTSCISPVGLEQSGHPGGLIYDEDLREEPGLGGGVEHLYECVLGSITLRMSDWHYLGIYSAWDIY